MHYYQFNIGDYQSHTSHLTEVEDIAYRRMLDWLYLHEKPLPKDVDKIARLIRMRTHSESIANVLDEFFSSSDNGFYSKRVNKDLKTFKEKSAKAKASANARWASKSGTSGNDANALDSQSEGNANHKPITNNHKPVVKEKAKRFIPPTIQEIEVYCKERNNGIDPIKFFNHYETVNWMRGSNKIKNWKACVITWENKNTNHSGQPKARKDFPS